MYTLSSDRFITSFSKSAAPALRVEDGATVRIATKDCYMDNLRAENDPRGAARGPAIGCNPASGPIYVEGARPGDTLRCDILAIDVGEYASMRISNRGGLMADRVTAPIVRCIPLKNGHADLAGVKMPLEPMIGVIGVAPEGEDVDTESPGAHGGNMDTRHIRAGSYPIYEITAGPTTARPNKEISEMNYFRVPSSATLARSFAQVKIEGAEGARTLTMTFINAKGDALFSTTIKQSDLQKFE